MNFVHRDAEFEDLLQIVAQDRGIASGLVEKDYWVTHVLWSLQRQGFELWFKGGTSLSKGFGLIQRFSEDLDLKIEPGTVASLPAVASWKSVSQGAVAARWRFFATLAEVIDVPDATAEVDLAADPACRSANLQVRYPGRRLDDLRGAFRPFVLLEVGNARVVPFVARDLTSFLHDHLDRVLPAAGFADNRPRGIRCVHPVVTLIEKLDAIARRFRRDQEPAAYVRHYEDAAQIIGSTAALPPLVGFSDPRALALSMLGERQIAAVPVAEDLAFRPAAEARWDRLQAAHSAIGPMYWGRRRSLEDACAGIRGWIDTALRQT